jgi:chaperonin GroES
MKYILIILTIFLSSCSTYSICLNHTPGRSNNENCEGVFSSPINICPNPCIGSNMRIKPLGNKVIIRREKKEYRNTGIILPHFTCKPSDIGTVVSIGPGKINHKGERCHIDLEIGDRVLFNSSYVEESHIEEDLIIVEYEYIYGILA